MPQLRKRKKKTFWIIRRMNRCGTEAKMFRVVRVSGRNPPAVPLRTISSEGSMVPAVLASERSKQRSLVYMARGKQRVTMSLRRLLTGAQQGLKPRHLSRGVSSWPRWMWLCQRVGVAPAVTSDGWDERVEPFISPPPPHIPSCSLHPQITLKQASVLHLI